MLGQREESVCPGMKKRGILGLGWAEIIGITLVAMIIVFAIAPFFGRLIAMFLGVGQEEAAAKANLVQLSVKINQLVSDPAKFAAQKNFQYGLPAWKFILIAFNYGEEISTTTCDSSGILGGILKGAKAEAVQRPNECKVGTCLCLYKDTVGIDFDEKPVMCQQFTRDVVFVGPGNKEEECAVDEKGNMIPCIRNEYIGPVIMVPGQVQEQPIPELLPEYNQIATWRDGWNFGAPRPRPRHPLLQKFDYENFVIYGACEQTAWNVQPMYIEKFTVNDKNYFFIAKQSSLTENRHRLLSLSFESIEAKLLQARYAETILDAHLFAETRKDDPQTPKVLLLIGNAFEAITTLPEEDAKAELLKLKPKYRNIDLEIGQLGWQRTAREHAAREYESLFNKHPKSTETIEAILKGAALFEQLGDLSRAERLRKGLAEFKGKSESVDLSILRESIIILERIKPERGMSEFKWLDFMRQIDRLRDDADKFLLRWPKSINRKEVLYLLAETNTKYPSERALEVGMKMWEALPLDQALQTYAQIVREFPTDWSLTVTTPAGDRITKDAKVALESLCREKATLAKQCKTLAEEDLVIKIPYAREYDLTKLDQRKEYFAAVQNYATGAEARNEIDSALAAYEEFTEFYFKIAEGEYDYSKPKYTEQDDYELLAKAFSTLGKLYEKKSKPSFAQLNFDKAQEYAQIAGVSVA